MLIFLKLEKIYELLWVTSRAQVDNVFWKRKLTQPRRLNPCVGLNKPELYLLALFGVNTDRSVRKLIPSEEHRIGDSLAEGVEVHELDPILAEPHYVHHKVGEGKGGGGEEFLEEARDVAHDARPLCRNVRVVVAPVPLGYCDEAAAPHEGPELRARTYVDPAAKDEAVGDAVAGGDWCVVAVTEWGPVEGKRFAISNGTDAHVKTYSPQIMLDKL